MDILLQRIHALQKSAVYSGTLYEGGLSSNDIKTLCDLRCSVEIRNCQIYPFFIKW